MKRAPRVVLEEQLPRVLSRAGWVCAFGGARLDRRRIVLETLEGCFVLPGPRPSFASLEAELERARTQHAAYWRATVRKERRALESLLEGGDWRALKEHLAPRLQELFRAKHEPVEHLLFRLTDRILDLAARRSEGNAFRVFATLVAIRLPHADAHVARHDVTVLYRVVEGRFVCPLCGAPLVCRGNLYSCSECSPRRRFRLGAPLEGELAGRFEVDLTAF